MARDKGRETATTLDPSSIEAVAQRVAELLKDTDTESSLIDAAEVARRYGLARSTVYEKAGELGAIRLGNGPRARLRFNPETVAKQLSGGSDGSPFPEGGQWPTRRRRRRSVAPAGARAQLLPIRAAPRK
jgi:hypothetical protein